jgi:protein-S-isoprenylcysteine O-methyltransferase
MGAGVRGVHRSFRDGDFCVTTMVHPLWLALLYGGSEILISKLLRSKNETSATDRGSLRVIWIVINLSMASAILAAFYLRWAEFDAGLALQWVGLVTFASGLALRWYSIFYLGRFFTVDVAIHADHQVIDTGPYRLIRHPSYAGALLAFFGLGLYLHNIATLLLMILPIGAVFLYRIRIEEAALLTGLGEPYRQYMQRTRRLIPFLY